MTWGSSLASSGGSLTKLGAGILTLGGSNTYTSGTTLDGGELSLGSSGALNCTNLITFAGGTLQATASNMNDYSSLFNTASGQAYSIDTNGQNVAWASPLTSSGGSLTKLGSGILTVSGVNTYSGATTVSAGTLDAQSTASLPGYNVSGKVSVANSATLAVMVGSGGWNSNSYVDDIATLLKYASFTAGASLGIDTSDGSFSYGGSIANTSGGTLGLVVMGDNILTLSGVNTYTSVTSVSSGTLDLASTAALAGYDNPGKVSVATGATLAVMVGGTSGWNSSPSTDNIAALWEPPRSPPAHRWASTPPTATSHTAARSGTPAASWGWSCSGPTR